MPKNMTQNVTNIGANSHQGSLHGFIGTTVACRFVLTGCEARVLCSPGRPYLRKRWLFTIDLTHHFTIKFDLQRDTIFSQVALSYCGCLLKVLTTAENKSRWFFPVRLPLSFCTEFILFKLATQVTFNAVAQSCNIVDIFIAAGWQMGNNRVMRVLWEPPRWG